MNKSLVVITGASSGIGEAIAKRFSELGYPLLLLARRIDRLESLNLPDCLCEKVDVTETESLTRAIAKAEDRYGAVEYLVNNAGVMLLGSPEIQAPSEWRQMLDVNILGLLNGIQSVLAAMKSRQSGTIVNISSVAGRKTFPNHAVYSGTKFAVHAITETVREEVAGSNVRMITISPGAVETELLGHTTSSDIVEGYEAWKEAMGGAIVADDVARSVVYAVSQPQNICIREIVIAATRQEA